MEPLLSRTRRVYQRLQDALPRLLDEFKQPEPYCFLDFTDDLDYSETRVRLLYEQTDRRGMRTGNQALLRTYYLLGRVLFILGSKNAGRTLRRWAPKSRASHTYRTAIRTYEVFGICGPAYIVATSLTPTMLREMSAVTYAEFLTHLQVVTLSVRSQEQAPEGENSVTAPDLLAAPSL